MTQEPVHPTEWIPELALGVLPAGEADPVRAHLEGCPECRAEYETMMSAARLLPLAATRETPSEDGRTLLLERVRSEPRNVTRMQQFQRRAGWVTAATAVLLLVMVGGAGFLAGRQTENDGRDALVQRQEAIVAAAATGALDVSRGGSDVSRVTLVGARDEDEGLAYVEDLPELPAGRAYQAWFSEDGATFEPSSVFDVASGGVWLTATGAMSAYSALAFTIEDEGGAAQPTSAPFVVVPLVPSAASR